MCSAPFGCPVLPELYMSKAASSASTGGNASDVTGGDSWTSGQASRSAVTTLIGRWTLAVNSLIKASYLVSTNTTLASQ